MKAVLFHEYGGVDKLVYEEIETPKPGFAEVLVEMKAIGVNHFDHDIREGISGRKVAHQDGRSETTVRGRYRASWGIISRGLDRARQIEACKARKIRPLDR